LLYRLIYHELLVPADEVTDLASLAAYLVCNYLLYLRVSGQFHIACGMLHLFGFDLPATHRDYLLATSFTDFWRRINIYWKDFMVRLVFNPVVFRLKRWPRPLALAVATVVVFTTTWVLHGYQSYWLRGSWGFGVPDALFWGVLGLLVMVNVQLDARRSGSTEAPAAANARMQAVQRWAVLVWTSATVAALALGGMAAGSVAIARAYEHYSSVGGLGLSGWDLVLVSLIVVPAVFLVWLGLRLRGREPAKPDAAGRDPLALRVTKTAWTFVTIAVLWSLWSSPTVEEWLAMMRRGVGI
jgi:D-alanyl-lipoteichoic acid acyltransferase DltB (MBOAT superfamily)